MRRIVALVIALLAAAATLVITFPHLARLERSYPFAQLVAARLSLAAVFAGLAVLALLLCSLRLTRAIGVVLLLVFGAGAAGNAWVAHTRGFEASELPPVTDTSVRVMAWNTAGEATTPDQVAQIAVGMAADIVSLPETNDDNGERIAIAMRQMGRPMWVHHVTYGGWDARRTTLLISPRLGDYSVIDSSADGSSNTTVVPSAVAMPVDGTGPTIVAVHAVAPRESYMSEWEEDLRWIADQCPGGNVIMAGDFNATLDSMARLGSEGGTLGACRDAATDAGTGSTGTWPTSVPSAFGAPIDHVFVSDAWHVTGAVVLTSLDTSGSDHRPLVVQLEPAG